MGAWQARPQFRRNVELVKDVRATLEARATLGCLTVAEVQTSRDGTRKLRLLTRDGQSIESVLIPDGDKTTQRISSQVGCAVDCQFCATAKLGLKRNLDAGEIVDQVYLAQRLLAEVDPDRRITNLVYMGMGWLMQNHPQSGAIATYLSERRQRCWVVDAPSHGIDGWHGAAPRKTRQRNRAA